MTIKIISSAMKVNSTLRNGFNEVQLILKFLNLTNPDSDNYKMLKQPIGEE